MKRLDLIVERIRSQSGNGQYSAGAGISQNDMVQWVQSAQDFIFSQANQNRSNYFIEEDPEVDVVSGQEAYTIPLRGYLNALELVEYSASGNARDYYPLMKVSLHERSASHEGYPSSYSQRGRQILLAPPAVSGKLRFNFKKELDRLDVRRGKISAHTKAGGAVTALTLDTSEGSFDATELNKYNYLCVVDRNGDIKLRNLEYDSVASDTGIVTITDGTFSYGSDESIENGYYVVAGEDTTNRSTLPITCERFLIAFGLYSAKHRDKSKWSSEALKDVMAMASDIIDGFTYSNSDVESVPITSVDYFDSDPWY